MIILTLFYIFIVIIILFGGIIFLYLNLKMKFKINCTLNYINIYFDVLILGKKIWNNKKIYYVNFLRSLLFDKKMGVSNYMNYTKYFRFFVIKHMDFYIENYNDDLSIAIEFYIVNNKQYFQKGLLNE